MTAELTPEARGVVESIRKTEGDALAAFVERYIVEGPRERFMQKCLECGQTIEVLSGPQQFCSEPCRVSAQSRRARVAGTIAHGDDRPVNAVVLGLGWAAACAAWGFAKRAGRVERERDEWRRLYVICEKQRERAIEAARAWQAEATRKANPDAPHVCAATIRMAHLQEQVEHLTQLAHPMNGDDQ